MLQMAVGRKGQREAGLETGSSTRPPPPCSLQARVPPFGSRSIRSKLHANGTRGRGAVEGHGAGCERTELVLLSSNHTTAAVSSCKRSINCIRHAYCFFPRPTAYSRSGRRSRVLRAGSWCGAAG
jgi:hypothetical protein